MSVGTVAAVSTKRKPGTKVRYRWHGLTHVQELHAGKWRTWIVIGRRRRMLLNESLPIAEGRQYIAHPQDAECGKCGYLYTEVMTQAKQQCGECDLEQAAEHGKRLEQQGIQLGWGYREKIDAESTDPAWNRAAKEHRDRRFGEHWDTVGYWKPDNHL